MNVAQLLGELDSAVSQAKEAGERVRKAIEGLKSVFGSVGLAALSPAAVTVIEPTLPLDNGEKYVCPYCLKEFPSYKRPHRDSPHATRRFLVSRHIGSMRIRRHDHGAKNDPIPWVR